VYEIISYLLKRRFLWVVYIVLSSLSICAQPKVEEQKKIDSLEVVISNNSGINKFDPTISLVRVYGNINNDVALNYAKDARDIAYQHGDSSRIVLSSRIMSQLFNRLAKYKEAEQILSASIGIAKRNHFKDEYKTMLSNLAIAYTFQAQYDKALEVSFQALVLRESDKDYPEITLLLNNIGVTYFKLKNYPNALEFYMRALSLKESIHDTYDLDRLLINIGLCYNQLKNFARALEYFEKAFKQCGTNCTDKIKLEGEFGFGVCYFNQDDLSEAQKHFNESLNISKKIGNQRFQAENLIYLARIYIREKKIDAAIIELTKCENISRVSKYNQLLIETYKEFLTLYNEQNDYEKASYYQSKYIHLKDSIYSENLIDNIAKIRTDFAERENKAIIATKEEVIQRQHSLNIAIGIIAVLALLLIFVLVHSNRARKRVNQALTEANEIIELKNKELDKKVAEKTADLEVANESLSKVNEELDNFIYKTSHDIRGPLASLKGICNVALMDVKDITALDYLRKLDITAEHLNTILTRLLIINQINNSAMKPELINFDSIVDEVLMLERKKGLPGSLNIRRQIQTNTRFYSDKEFIRIIMENLIDNAIKFYNDSHRIDPFVDIFVEQTEDEIKISVVDNGIGISEVKPDKIFQMFSRASERSGTGGIGLYITKTATEKLGGSVGLKTTPEGHTLFYVKFPLKQQWFEDPAWSS
jgi:signal transduction histidine kinase